MKNEKFIHALDKVKPSIKEKDKMLENILSKRKRTKNYRSYVWKFGMVSLCFCCSFLIINGFYNEEASTRDNSVFIRPATFEAGTNELCYQDICYEEKKVLKNKAGGKYLDTIYKDNEEIMIYQGEQEGTIIIKRENSYFLYQKIER